MEAPFVYFINIRGDHHSVIIRAPLLQSTQYCTKDKHGKYYQLDSIFNVEFYVVRGAFPTLANNNISGRRGPHSMHHRQVRRDGVRLI